MCKIKQKHVILIEVLIFFSLILIFSYNLGKSEFWMDEGPSFKSAIGILEYGVPVSNFDYNFFEWQSQDGLWDPLTPLNRYLIALSFFFLGISEFSARIPFVIFGVLSLFLIYRVSKYFFSEKIYALLSSVLLATYPIFIAFIKQARWYGLFFFIFPLTLYLFHLLIETKEKKYFILFSLSFLLTLLTHSLGFIIIPICFIYLIWTNEVGILKNKYFLLTLILIFLPYLFIFSIYWRTLPFFHYSCLLDPIVYFSTLFSYIYGIFVNQISRFILLPLLLIFGLIVSKKSNKKIDKLLISWFFVSFLFVSFEGIPHPRFLIPIILFPLIILSMSGIKKLSNIIYRKKSHWIAILISVLIVLNVGTLFLFENNKNTITDTDWKSNFFGLIFYYSREEYLIHTFESNKIISDYIKKEIPKDDIIITNLNDISLSYYSKRNVMTFLNERNSTFYFKKLDEGDVWVIEQLPFSQLYFCPNDITYDGSCYIKYKDFIDFYRKNCEMNIIPDNENKLKSILFGDNAWNIKVYHCKFKY